VTGRDDHAITNQRSADKATQLHRLPGLVDAPDHDRADGGIPVLDVDRGLSGSHQALCLIEFEFIRHPAIHTGRDQFHRLLPRRVQRALDLLSILSTALFAILLAYVGWRTVQETLEFRSTAPTPWATPLIWPQSLWLAGLVLFAALATVAAAHAAKLAAARHWRDLDRNYGPKGTEEEIREELADLERR